MKTPKWMRKANAIVSAAILLTFFLHAVGNAFMLLGVGNPVNKRLSDVLLLLVLIHIVFGVILTVQTFRAMHESGVSYPQENRRFWTIRISGVLIVVAIVAHVLGFGMVSEDPYRLNLFGKAQLAYNLLLVASIAVHIVANARPYMVSLGMANPRDRALDVAFVCSVLLGFLAAAFIVYFIRWSVA